MGHTYLTTASNLTDAVIWFRVDSWVQTQSRTCISYKLLFFTCQHRCWCVELLRLSEGVLGKVQPSESLYTEIEPSISLPWSILLRVAYLIWLKHFWSSHNLQSTSGIYSNGKHVCTFARMWSQSNRWQDVHTNLRQQLQPQIILTPRNSAEIGVS